MKCYICSNKVNKLGAKYCSNACQVAERIEALVTGWLDGLDCGWTGKTYKVKNFVRRYMIDKAENKCSKCGWCEVHPVTGRVPLEINHIDGDASNCKQENLEVLCPNCHSLTPNFRNLNSDSVRRR